MPWRCSGAGDGQPADVGIGNVPQGENGIAVHVKSQVAAVGGNLIGEGVNIEAIEQSVTVEVPGTAGRALTAAMASTDRARQLLAPLIDGPYGHDVRLETALCDRADTDPLFVQRKYKRAAQSAEKAVAVMASLVQKTASDEQLLDLAKTYHGLGMAWQLCNHRESAIEAFHNALEAVNQISMDNRQGAACRMLLGDLEIDLGKHFRFEGDLHNAAILQALRQLAELARRQDVALASCLPVNT